MVTCECLKLRTTEMITLPTLIRSVCKHNIPFHNDWCICKKYCTVITMNYYTVMK